jgi:hypothetical protein
MMGGRPMRRFGTVALMCTLVAAHLGGGVGSAAGPHRGHVRLTFDAARFAATQPITSIETFEGLLDTQYPPTLRRPVIDSVRYHSLDPADPWWGFDVETRTSETDLSTVLVRRFSETGFLSKGELALGFRDGGSVRAIGLWLTISSFPNQFELRVTEANGATTSFMLPADVQGRIFIGLSSFRHIRRVLITQHPELTAGGMSNFSIDDVSRTKIKP